jgi:WD40 repeat protein
MNIFLFVRIQNHCSSLGGDLKVIVWNVGTASILTTIDCHPESILSISWNYNGSRIVTSCKDKLFRVINPRNGEVIQVEKLTINWTIN